MNELRSGFSVCAEKTNGVHSLTTTATYTSFKQTQATNINFHVGMNKICFCMCLCKFSLSSITKPWIL